MNKTIVFFLLGAVLAWFSTSATANHVTVTNVTVIQGNYGGVGVEFDLSWQNSWRDEFNHDAVWLFLKYSTDQGANWHHATLRGMDYHPEDYSSGTNSSLEIIVSPDGRGAFVQRSVPGRGPVQTSGMRLCWDARGDGVSPTTLGRVSLHALEMVYIPEAPFYVGDDSSENSFRVTYINTPDPNRMTPASGDGTLANPYVNLEEGMGRPQGTTGEFSPGYPNGYQAFYIMKYPLSRALYLDFLNLLTATQAEGLKVNFSGSNGTIVGTHPNLSNAEPWRALTWTESNEPSWGGCREYLAYMDWAGLRPLTEMEYEKACRGPDLPTDRDFPWGTADSALIPNRVVEANTAAETPVDRNANILMGQRFLPTLSIPLRPGVFAGANTDQIQAGASYYGVMDMAGNAGQLTVSAGAKSGAGAVHEKARNFMGEHGDGSLNPDGTTTMGNWPIPDATLYSGGPMGHRGSNNLSTFNSTVASRPYATTIYYSYPRGVRGARTAP